MPDTDPALVLDELLRREPIFHRRELGITRSEFEEMTADDFWETGASGRRYGREDIWAVLEKRYAADPGGVSERWVIRDEQVREIAADTYLLTYTLTQDGRITRRLTVWQKQTDIWVILYHQGTPVTAGD